MMSFIHSGSEIKIYRVSSGNKLDGIVSYIYGCIHKPFYISLFNKNVLISSVVDAENIFASIPMFLQIMRIYICNGYPKLKSIFGF